MNYFLKLFLFIALFLVSCISLKHSESFRKKSYKYSIEYNDHEFLVSLKYDTSKNIDFRLFDKSGIKIFESVLYRDSINIKYCIGQDYNKLILEYYHRFNKEFGVFELINQINFGFNINDKIKYNFQLNEKNILHCIELNNFYRDYIITICSDNWSKNDSIFVSNNFDILKNDTKILTVKRIND